MPWSLPSPVSPLGSAPWPRGTAARPPQCAPSWRALHRGPGFSAPVVLRPVLHAISEQLVVRVARLRGATGLPLRGLAIPLLHDPSILHPLPIALYILVIHRVQLPSAR
eukprot:scaffold34687_cov63-Phaeocystis_antarctica.AAC.6